MAVFLILIVIIILLCAYLYHSASQARDKFESKGVPYKGNSSARFFTNSFKGIGLIQDVRIQYLNDKKKGYAVAGTKDFGQDVIVINHPDLLKSILIKDFDHFAERRQFGFPKGDFLLKKMLITQKGEKWRALRSKLSPTFTTGKIKRLFNLFDESGKKLVKFLNQELETADGNGEIDLSIGLSKLPMDIIASAACGIDGKAFDQKDPSLFEEMGKQLQFQFSFKVFMKIVVMMTSQKLTDFLGITLLGKDAQQFFSTAIRSSIHHRQANKEKRDDFLQLMLEARDGLLKLEESELGTFEKEAVLKPTASSDDTVSADILDDDGIVSNASLFLIGGSDTTNSLLTFLSYNLALNQDCQERLRKDVNAVFERNGGKLSSDDLNQVTYFDMVINETLRMYPPAAFTDRGCTMDYKIPGTEYIIKKGEGIMIPIYGIHYDPEYYPNPEKFDPERFSSENKGKLRPYTFLPFGQGPRNCIGMRFAMAEVKVAISHLLHNFKIEPSRKTLIPMKFSKATTLKPEGGLFLSLTKLN